MDNAPDSGNLRGASSPSPLIADASRGPVGVDHDYAHTGTRPELLFQLLPFFESEASALESGVGPRFAVVADQRLGAVPDPRARNLQPERVLELFNRTNHERIRRK